MFRGIEKLNQIPFSPSTATPSTTPAFAAGTAKLGIGYLSSILPTGLDEVPSGSESVSFQPDAIQNKLNSLPYCPVNLISTNANTGKNYVCYITSTVEDIDQYLDLLETLSSMDTEDTMTIYIDSPGGYICTGVIISTFITDCKGHVTTCARGLCASAGSLIWSAGHTCTCSPFALFMWHMSSHGDCTNSLRMEKEAKTQVEYVRLLLLNRSLEKNHITQEEVDKICNDTDYICWITADEMLKRIQNSNKEEILNPSNDGE